MKICAHFVISFTRKQLKCIQHFCIHSNGRSFRLARQKLIIGSYFTNYSKTITHQAEIFEGKLSTIVIVIPCKLCVHLWTLNFVFRSYQCCPGSLTHEGNKLAHFNGSQCSNTRETCTVYLAILMNRQFSRNVFNKYSMIKCKHPHSHGQT